MIARSIVRAGLASLLCVAASASLSAQQTNTVVKGLTSLRLSAPLLSALRTLDVTVGVVAPTTITTGSVANFPVVGGAVDLETGHGDFLHSGGLTFSSGGTKVVLQSFVIDTTSFSNPTLIGLVSVNGKLLGPVALFNVIPPIGASAPATPVGGMLNLKDVYLTLTPGAASALNSAFSVSAFVPNFTIGAATVSISVQAN